jgi:hypothetical protein
VFKGDATLKEKMEVLGLSYAALEGGLYTQKDYHIDERWEGSGGEYRLWAGDKWEGIYVPSDDWYYPDSEDGEKPAKPDPESRFVGLRIYRGSWQNSMTWVDQDGLLLTGFAGRRDETDASGELSVKRGAEWMTNILKAVAGYKVRNPKSKTSELPQGRGWSILSNLRDEDNENNNQDIERWDIQNYEVQCINLEWREDDGRQIAILTAHHDFHPFYLAAELDLQPIVEAHAKLDAKARKAIRRPDIDSGLTWIAGAEDSLEVFERRRVEARTQCTALFEAIRKAAAAHSLDALTGRLDDPELIKRLGIEFKPVEFKAGDYEIRRQMLGDVEICVGSPRTGGRMWLLANVAEGKIIRSSQ